MNRVFAALFIVGVFVVPARGVSDEPSTSSELEPLRYRGEILQPPAPDAHDPLSYDEIIWPWEMELGDPTQYGWGPARARAYWAMQECQRAQDVFLGAIDEHGSPVRFTDPLSSHVYRISFAAMKDASVLENLKFFPEVREITITTHVSLGDSLTVLRYCPHLTKLRVSGFISGTPQESSPLDLSQKSLEAIGSLSQLRQLSLVNLAIDDAECKQLEGMKNLLFFEIINGDLTSRSLPTVASWPRIRYLKLYSCDFSRPIDDEERKALELLVGRVELLQMNPYPDDFIQKPTRIDESFETLFEKIRENGFRARQAEKDENTAVAP